jgi:hypothetical protein
VREALAAIGAGASTSVEATTSTRSDRIARL